MIQELNEWELEDYDGGEFEFEDEDFFEMEGTEFDEMEEMELATELLEVSNEEELEQFLGKLVKSAVSKARTFLRSRTGKAVKGLLRGAARQALPWVGGAIGGRIGGKTGAAAGRYLAGQAGRYFGLETEGLSMEDEEFARARQFVRFGRSAVKNSIQNRHPYPSRARHAVTLAARRYLPGINRRRRRCPSYRRPY